MFFIFCSLRNVKHSTRNPVKAYSSTERYLLIRDASCVIFVLKSTSVSRELKVQTSVLILRSDEKLIQKKNELSCMRPLYGFSMNDILTFCCIRVVVSKNIITKKKVQIYLILPRASVCVCASSHKRDIFFSRHIPRYFSRQKNRIIAAECTAIARRTDDTDRHWRRFGLRTRKRIGVFFFIPRKTFRV